MSPIQRGISHREHGLREMLMLSAGKLFQDVGYVQASIYRIASAVNAPKGTSEARKTLHRDLSIANSRLFMNRFLDQQVLARATN
jgi:hypothetical protein